MDPLQEQEEGRGQPRGEFLLFIASILGAARERERDTGNSNDDDGRHPIPKAAVNGATDGRTSNQFTEQNFLRGAAASFSPPVAIPRQTAPSPARWKKDREGHKRERKRDRGFIAAKTNAISYTLPSTCLIDT